MDAFYRLLRFGRAAKARVLPAWKSVQRQSEPALQWLRLQSERGLQWLQARPRVVFWAGGIGIALVFLVVGGPLAAGAALGGWAALRQAATASERHQEQTNADRQRRITESFSKAVEQLWQRQARGAVGWAFTRSSEAAQGFRKAAANASRTFVELLSALDRKRGKGGQQVVRVEHVHVHKGGQAIVGNVQGGDTAAVTKRAPPLAIGQEQSGVTLDDLIGKQPELVGREEGA
jgi:hypothetical protein